MIIKSPSRLHMSLIDLSGAYGRIDGGIGLTLQDPNFVLFAEPSEKGIQIDFDDSIVDNRIIEDYNKKINDAASKMIEYYDDGRGFYFKVMKAYPPHSGLGSGTQIALSTAKLISEFNGDSLDSLTLSTIIGRGGTSGIGTFAFDKGGFIIDAGRSIEEKDSFLPSAASEVRPPLLFANYDFPEDWEILIVILSSADGVSGKEEVNIFQDYCPLPKNEVLEVSHLIFMNMVPFLLEKNLPAFGTAIDKIQNLGFKKVEVELQTDKLKNLMNKMRELGAYGVGMSSFGPTVYTIFDKNNKYIVDEMKEYVGDDGIVFTTKAKNSGHEIIK
ncbi:MAG: beta-ribofuranosylaminobenzene 5'-phosphate synthase [Methanobrevibacter sp.]|uniref:beta-ribofuranosylaminobenzene 5'-phosphate synthase n=1 Tax=Methanobrevibacter sp. TaxID=66852 RepID=UPI0026E02285|nr:beta-ribofuranosylaminobenzene 5'-phosphate synthase [Methanobrevibacter sp.]MDO5848297.1 beta-ribofuranosylaminobenzene 5'-phosphate synthase [Methanobrevibacter sp.]